MSSDWPQTINSYEVSINYLHEYYDTPDNYGWLELCIRGTYKTRRQQPRGQTRLEIYFLFSKLEVRVKTAAPKRHIHASKTDKTQQSWDAPPGRSLKLPMPPGSFLRRDLKSSFLSLSHQHSFVACRVLAGMQSGRSSVATHRLSSINMERICHLISGQT